MSERTGTLTTMRTRFSPSPTGFLHVGGLRTALYSYILAKQAKGTFLLRIEDTDKEREVPGATENILTNLHWAHVDPDEGVMLRDGIVTQVGRHAPYIQSERAEKGIYRRYADELVIKGHAYPCFCSTARLEEMRKAQEARKQAPMYDRLCMGIATDKAQKRIAAGERHVIRLKVPQERLIEFEDDIRGPLAFQGHTIDDQVLLKSNGIPTYHLAHVVDDHLMEIDLVLRGEEWLSSLPKHLLLFEFLGWPPPRYAHVPLLLNPDRTKLSKRTGSVTVDAYREKGYLPEALINFLALLGWNPGAHATLSPSKGGTSRASLSGTGQAPGKTQEIFTMEDLIGQFNLSRVQKAGAIFDLKKLDWLQGQWIRRIPRDDFIARVRPLVERAHPAARSDSQFDRKAALIQDRITFFNEATDMLSYFYIEPVVTEELIVNKKQKVTEVLLPSILGALIATLEKIDTKEWSEETLKAALLKLVDATAAHSTGSGHVSPAGETWKLGQVLWVLRAALTGRAYSPGAFEVAGVFGKEKTLERLKRCATLAP